MVEYRIVRQLSLLHPPGTAGLNLDYDLILEEPKLPPSSPPSPSPSTTSFNHSQYIQVASRPHPTTITSLLDSGNFTTMCHCYDDDDPVLRLWHKVHLIIYSLAPFPLLCVLNFIVVRKTRDAAKSAAKSAAKLKSQKSSQSTNL